MLDEWKKAYRQAALCISFCSTVFSQRNAFFKCRIAAIIDCFYQTFCITQMIIYPGIRDRSSEALKKPCIDIEDKWKNLN